MTDFFIGLLDSIRILRTRALRTFLALLGVVFGVGAVISMVAIGEGARRQILSQIEALGSRLCVIEQLETTQADAAKLVETSGGLNMNDFNTLAQGFSYGDTAAVLALHPAIGPLPRLQARLLATTFAFPWLKDLKLVSGRLWLENEHHSLSNVALAGRDLAKELGVGSDSVSRVQIDQAFYEVIGVFQVEGDDPNQLNRALVIPLASAWQSLDEPAPYGQLSQILIRAKSLADTLNVKSFAQGILDKKHNGQSDYSVFAPIDLLEQRNRQDRIFHTALLLIAAISLLVGGIGIMNIMLANVLERIPEIGVRRAVGATRQHIFLQFLSEAVLICFLGGLLGLLFGVLLAIAVGKLFLMPVAFPLWVPVIAIGISVGSGLIFGLMPAVHAMRIGPVEALRMAA